MPRKLFVMLVRFPVRRVNLLQVYRCANKKCNESVLAPGLGARFALSVFFCYFLFSDVKKDELIAVSENFLCKKSAEDWFFFDGKIE